MVAFVAYSYLAAQNRLLQALVWTDLVVLRLSAFNAGRDLSLV